MLASSFHSCESDFPSQLPSTSDLIVSSTLLIGIVVIMEVVKTKKEKTPKKVAKAEADDADFMIQPEQVAPRIDTSK